MTLANVTVTSGNVTLTNVTVTTANVTNATITTANVTTANIATEVVTTSQTLSYGAANGIVYLNGSKVSTTGASLTFNGTNFATTGSVTSAGASNSGNLTFTGTGNRITGDFSNATLANRVMFQTSTANSATIVEFLPSGSGTVSGVNFGSSSDLANTSILSVSSLSTDARFNAGFRGTGTYLPMTFYTGGSLAMQIDTNRLVQVGTTSADGQVHIKAATGQGTPLTLTTTDAGANTQVVFKGSRTYQIGTGNASSGFAGSLFFYDGTAAQTRMLIDSSGRVLVGRTGTFTGSETFVSNGFGSFGSDSAPQVLIGNTGSGVGVLGTFNNYGMEFRTNNTERMRILSTGNILSLSGGSTTATGTGIAFPATQSASSDANTLDDYEEGSWTPGIRFGGNTTGITYSARSGLYTKIGNMVYATFNIDLSSKGSATGSAQLTGLPFASNGTTRGGGAVTYYHSTPALANCGGLLLLIEAADTNVTLRFYNSSTGLSADLTNSNFNNNTGYWGVLTYPI
jgi:hypothetical protein